MFFPCLSYISGVLCVCVQKDSSPSSTTLFWTCCGTAALGLAAAQPPLPLYRHHTTLLLPCLTLAQHKRGVSSTSRTKKIMAQAAKKSGHHGVAASAYRQACGISRYYYCSVGGGTGDRDQAFYSCPNCWNHQSCGGGGWRTEQRRQLVGLYSWPHTPPSSSSPMPRWTATHHTPYVPPPSLPGIPIAMPTYYTLHCHRHTMTPTHATGSPSAWWLDQKSDIHTTYTPHPLQEEAWEEGMYSIFCGSHCPWTH